LSPSRLWHICVLLAAMSWFYDLDNYVSLIHSQDRRYRCVDYKLI